MMCLSLTLEAAKLLWVPRAWCADSIRLAMISVVANCSLTSWNLSLEFLCGKLLCHVSLPALVP
jgi:hypothetical protein